MISAAIDIGTNTALLLVAEIYGNSRIRILHDEQQFVRLGEGLVQTHVISLVALDRLIKTLKVYKDIATSFGSEQIIVAGTSASREADNRDELIRMVAVETGLDYEIITSDEEARWAFAGTISEFPELAGSCIVVDVGGGSTEIIIGEKYSSNPLDFKIQLLQSIDIGAVRLTEKFFSALPPQLHEREAMEAEIRIQLDSKLQSVNFDVPFIGSAGTASALALLHGGIHKWNESLVSDVVIKANDLIHWKEHLLKLSNEEILALNHPVLQGRSDVFPAGIMILERIFNRFGSNICRVSPRGLRHGLLLRAASL